MKTSTILRSGAIAAVLLAGSCAAPTNDGSWLADGARNHPITVSPDTRALRLGFAGDGLRADEEEKFQQFVADYRARGNGAISVSAPAGAGAPAAIRYFGERLAGLGVDRSRILVGTRDVTDGDNRVELGYVTYVAEASPCGNWSKNLADAGSNLPSRNFGCATQHNLAAQIADPRDLLGPRPMGTADTGRRTTVVGKYQKGETTSAAKSSDQTATVSEISN